MTDTPTADFTAARILAVAARDAVSRLRDELQRLRPAAEGDDKKIAAAIIDYADYLIPECNAAIGAWTRAGDLQPQPKYDPFADLLGDPDDDVPKCPLSADPKCPTDQCPPQCERYAGCGVKVDPDAAEDAAIELAKAISKATGIPVCVFKL